MHRTTVRIEPELVEAAKKLAARRNLSFQKVINWSLKIFLQPELTDKPKNESKDLIDSLPVQNLGINLGTINREQIYGSPKI